VDLGGLQPNREIQQLFEAVHHPGIASVGVGGLKYRNTPI
jgi:hypothetical protein